MKIAYSLGLCLMLIAFLIKPVYANELDLLEHATVHDNFPKQGVSFIDISDLLSSPQAFANVIDHLTKRYESQKVDAVIGLESRGFMFASALAYKLKTGMIMARKPNKLPGQVASIEYQKEYGNDVLQIQKTQIKPGQRVVIIDDLYATGGTMQAAVDLAKQLGAEVIEAATLFKLNNLPEQKDLSCPLYSITNVY